MPKNLAHSFLSISNSKDFERLTLQTFRFQATKNKVYADFVHSLRINPQTVQHLEEIPFLPIEFFKTHSILSGEGSIEKVFMSSGTGGNRSKHEVHDIQCYIESFRKGFKLAYGNIHDYCILALLPSYIENGDSSLVFMADDLIKQSKHPNSGFYLNNHDDLANTLHQLEEKKQKTLLLGVSYSLMDFAEKHAFPLQHTTIMETGGMKGRRKELIREELHAILGNAFGLSAIHSEYGMTELLSQAYSQGDGLFSCPPWMHIYIRDINDYKELLPFGKTGGINVIDLANYYSCSFIATQDLGTAISNKQFSVLGRFDNSDLRGCNLMVG